MIKYTSALIFSFLYASTCLCWSLFDATGNEQARTITQIPVCQKVALVCERQKLQERLDTIKEQIFTLKKQLGLEDIRCKSIAFELDSMDLGTLAQESKRAYLPCIVTQDTLHIRLKDLCEEYNQIVALLTQAAGA